MFGNESSPLISVVGMKVPGNESSQERKFQGTKVPRNESSRERKFQLPRCRLRTFPFLTIPGLRIYVIKQCLKAAKQERN